jgi:histidinol phosphatase-like enzyme
MLFQAARNHQINLAASWFIGDILNDVEAGRRADCRSILIDNGNETEWNFSPLRRPHYVTKDLMSAANFILENDEYGC